MILFYWEAFARLHLLSSSIQLLIESQILACHRILVFAYFFFLLFSHIHRIKSLFYWIVVVIVIGDSAGAVRVVLNRDRFVCRIVLSFFHLVSFYFQWTKWTTRHFYRNFLLFCFLFFHYCLLCVRCLLLACFFTFCFLLFNVQSINRHSRFKNLTAMKKDK